MTLGVLQFIAIGFCNASVYSMVAVGFGLIFFSCRTFHIAHGAVYTLAGFTTYAGLALLGWPLAASAAGGLIACITLGAVIEIVIYYPLINPQRARKASSAILMMSSLGAYIIVVNFIAMIAGNDVIFLRPGVAQTVKVPGVILTHVQVAQLIVGGGSLGILAIALRVTQFGRTIRALSDDPELVSILGHSVRMYRIGIMVAGSALAGAGSILAALDVGINPHVGFSAVLTAAVATIAGGFGRLLAPALGCLLLALLQSFVVWQTSQKWSSAVVFGFLILILLLRPQGILSSVKRLEVH